MRDSPTLVELRGRVFKHAQPGAPPGPEIGNWLARRWGRPSAVYGTWLAVRLGLSADQVTLAALVACLGQSAALGSGTRWGFLAATVLGHLAYWLDHVDGQVARWHGTSSLSGVYHDYILHHVHGLCLGFAFGFGLAMRTGDVRWAAAGFAIALGWAALGLQNDCRYKAMFQRLKKEGRGYRVDLGPVDRPAPPPGWPRRGAGVVLWPAFKVCEPHVVLVGLTALGVLAAVDAPSWLAAWRWTVRVMAVLAPALAAGRVARHVMLRRVDAEFDRMFRAEPEA